MDIQQLTLVINLLKDVADGALIGFILYLAVAHLLPYLFEGLVVYLVYRIFSLWIANAFHLDWFKEQAKVLGQSWSYTYDWSDVEKTQRLISHKLSSNE